MNVDVSDYMSEYEIKDIIERAVREHTFTKMKTADTDTLFRNAVYYSVQKKIDELFDTDPYLSGQLYDQVATVIAHSTKFNLFQKADSYQEESTGQKILDKAVRDSEGVIRGKVFSEVANLGYETIREMIVDSVRVMWEENDR